MVLGRRMGALALAAAVSWAAHNIPYHNSVSNTGEMFDREAAEAFAAPHAMVVNPESNIAL